MKVIVELIHNGVTYTSEETEVTLQEVADYVVDNDLKTNSKAIDVVADQFYLIINSLDKYQMTLADGSIIVIGKSILSNSIFRVREV